MIWSEKIHTQVAKLLDCSLPFALTLGYVLTVLYSLLHRIYVGGASVDCAILSLHAFTCIML